MGELLMALLKMLATTATKGVTAAGKGALALGKKAVGGSQIGKLAEALGGSVENLTQKPSVPITPESSIQPPSWQTPQIPQQYSPMAQSMQRPMPQSMGPQINQPAIPPQYANMGMPGTLPQAQATESRGSFLGGLKEGFLGMPQTGESVPYYMGKLIPDIMRSKMGVSTAGEEAKSQKLMQAYGLKEYSPEFRVDIAQALQDLQNPNLTEEKKILLYQRLAVEYPDRTNELKRIFFPQSTTNEAWYAGLQNLGKI